MTDQNTDSQVLSTSAQEETDDPNAADPSVSSSATATGATRANTAKRDTYVPDDYDPPHGWGPQWSDIPQKGEEPKLLSAVDLLKHDDRREPEVLPGILAAGVTLLTGPPGAHKGDFARGLAMALATDTDFLGVPVRPGARVLYICNRMSPEALAERFRVFDKTALERSVGRLSIHGRFMKDFMAQISLEQVVGTVAGERKFDVVVIDDFDHLVRSYMRRGQFILQLRDWSLKIGVPVLLVHQTTKAKADNPAAMLVGSDILASAAETIVTLRPYEEAVRMRVVAQGMNVQDVLVRPTDWTVVGPAQDEILAGGKALVEAELLDATELLGPTDLKIATGLEIGNVNVSLWRLKKDGKVINEGRGRYRHVERTDLKPKETQPKVPKAATTP